MTHSMHPTISQQSQLRFMFVMKLQQSAAAGGGRDGAGTTSKGEKAEHLSLLLGGGGTSLGYLRLFWETAFISETQY